MHAGYHNKYIYVYILSLLHSSNRTTERIVVSIHGFFFLKYILLSFFFSEGSSSIDKRGRFIHA